MEKYEMHAGTIFFCGSFKYFTSTTKMWCEENISCEEVNEIKRLFSGGDEFTGSATQ
jgi:hypothetical protein